MARPTVEYAPSRDDTALLGPSQIPEACVTTDHSAQPAPQSDPLAVAWSVPGDGAACTRLGLAASRQNP